MCSIDRSIDPEGAKKLLDGKTPVGLLPRGLIRKVTLFVMGSFYRSFKKVIVVEETVPKKNVKREESKTHQTATGNSTER